ncbi:MAG: phage antirepressor KilAC domain-containing protein [Rhodobacteraceae bacterium]|nr:phage antirepressor KilAC domain-containing protein [Paracoccaceae bacterium]
MSANLVTYLTQKQIIIALREVIACPHPQKRRALIEKMKASNAPDVIRSILASDAHLNSQQGAIMQIAQLEPQADVATMSSGEIAKLVESRHDKVKQSIERLVKRDVITRPPMGDEFIVGKQRPQRVYRLTKRDSYVVVAQLSPEFTARLVDRWQELESGAMALPDFKNPALAARAWADQVEGRQVAEVALRHAQPMIDAHEILLNSEGSLCITDAAKTLQMRPKELFAWLSEHRWIYRRKGSAWLGYSAMLVAGFLEHKITTITRTAGPKRVMEQVRVTPKGLARLARVVE